MNRFVIAAKAGAIVILLAVAAFLIYQNLADRRQEAPGMAQEAPQKAAGYHTAVYMKDDLYTGLLDPPSVDVYGQQVYGGIVSHHFYMERDIARFFLAMKDMTPRVIVVVGPNHFNAGSGSVLTSRYGYRTPWGDIEPDLDLIGALVSKGFATVEEQPFEQEHSISALAGFMKKVFPEACIVPLILKRGVDLGQANALGDELDKILPADSLVIGSVDFSHHMDRTRADFHDAQSVSALVTADSERLYSSEVDSPPSLAAVLRYFSDRKALSMDYSNTNQAYASGSLDSADVTSYVFSHFLAGKGATDENATFLYLGSGLPAGTPVDILSGLQGTESNFLRGGDAQLIGLAGSAKDCAKEVAPSYIPSHISRNVLYFKQTIGTCFISADSNENGGVVIKHLAHSSITFAEVSPSRENPGKFIADLKRDNSYVVVLTNSAGTKQAEDYIDAGADAVIISEGGIKPPEIYNNKIIVTGSGSLTGSGYTVGLVLAGSTETATIFPYNSHDHVPTSLSYSDARTFCDKLLKGLPAQDGCVFKNK